MKPKVIAYSRVAREVVEYLEETCDVAYFNNINPKTDPDFLAALKEAQGIIGLALKVDKELLDQAPHLKIICNVSVGYDNLDINELTKRKIMSCNTPGVLDDTTADAIFGILIASARRIAELDHYVKKGAWDRSLREELYGVDVHHKVLGIIGMGRIGRAIAKRAHCGFDMKILYHNRSRNPEAEQKYNAQYCELDELLQASDFVCLMTPLTPETYQLIGEREFKLMKKSAVFINGSRGKTVNEQDLVRALQNGEILAAGLDVFEKEPIDPDHPLLKLRNVVTTPHIGSSTTETETKMSWLAAENLVKGLNGELPPTLINPEVLD